MLAADDGEVVAKLSAPNCFINIWIEKERISKAKRGPESHCRIRRNLGRCGRPRPYLALIAEVRLVQLRRGYSREMVDVDDVDFRRPLDSVRRIAVGRHVKGLVCVLGVVKIVGDGELFRRTNVPVETG